MPRIINPISDESIAYAAYAWDTLPAGAQVILTDAIKTGKLRDNISFDEFNLFIQNYLHPVTQTPPKKKFPFFLILSYIFGCFGLLVVYGVIKDLVIMPALYNSAYATPHRTATPYRPPTITPPPASVPLIASTSIPNCLLWSQVTPSMEGKNVCVYGTVTDYQEKPSINSTYLYFGEPDQLFLVITDFFFTDFKDGECARAEGIVQLNTYKTPYIKIDELFFCE